MLGSGSDGAQESAAGPAEPLQSAAHLEQALADGAGAKRTREPALGRNPPAAPGARKKIVWMCVELGGRQTTKGAGPKKTRRRPMQFMMLMIPNGYRGNKKLDPGFAPDPEKVEEMPRFNEELGKAVKILSLNGLHPLNTGARVSFGKGKPTVTDGPFIETK